MATTAHRIRSESSLIDGCGTLFYIVSASGAYLEKAYKEKFYLSYRQAQLAATEASIKYAPAVYSVYPMIAESFGDKNQKKQEPKDCRLTVRHE